jgi:hypothetical protein
MAGVLAVLAAVVLLALILRVATAALVLTGLPHDIARFQVRSAFFGVGYTTQESETIVNHPVRRRIVLWLIVGGAVGIAGVLASSVVTLAREGNVALPLLTLLAGIAIVAGLGSIRGLDRALVRVCEAALRRTTALEVSDYEALLRLSGEHAVSQVTVRAGGRLAGRPLSDLPAGALVLGVQRVDGAYLDAPPASLVLGAGDALAVYGRDAVVARLDGPTSPGSEPPAG